MKLSDGGEGHIEVRAEGPGTKIVDLGEETRPDVWRLKAMGAAIINEIAFNGTRRDRPKGADASLLESRTGLAIHNVEVGIMLAIKAAMMMDDIDPKAMESEGEGDDDPGSDEQG